MARIRTIKPSFFKNEDLVELDFGVRLLFISLWTLADRDGRLEDRPKRIKMEMFPADNFDVDSGLNDLARFNFLVRYEIDGKKYIQINNFTKHQNPHHMEVKSEIPPPFGNIDDEQNDDGSSTNCEQPDNKQCTTDEQNDDGSSKGAKSSTNPACYSNYNFNSNLDTTNTHLTDISSIAPANQKNGVCEKSESQKLIGEIAQALKSEGMSATEMNLANPVVTELIAKGATPAMFAGAYREAVEKGIAKPFPYSLKIIEAQVVRAKNLQAQARASPKKPRSFNDVSLAEAVAQQQAQAQDYQALEHEL